MTLPWQVPSGKLVTLNLIVYGRPSVALDRNTMNRYVWWPAAMAVGIPKERRNGMHALRHYYASDGTWKAIDRPSATIQRHGLATAQPQCRDKEPQRKP